MSAHMSANMSLGTAAHLSTRTPTHITHVYTHVRRDPSRWPFSGCTPVYTLLFLSSERSLVSVAPIHMSAHMSVRMSVHMSVRMSLRISVRMSVLMSLHMSAEILFVWDHRLLSVALLCVHPSLNTGPDPKAQSLHPRPKVCTPVYTLLFLSSERGLVSVAPIHMSASMSRRMSVHMSVHMSIYMSAHTYVL